MTALRPARVYAATAHYDDPRLDTSRYFLTKRSRDKWAKQRREGFPAEAGYFEDDEGRPALPPARVETADSEPVVFP